MTSAYDAVVVGAGPAGSVAAACLARRGHEVLLVDRCDFPRDKACGDGVPPGTIELLNALGMDEEIRAADFYPIHGIRLGSPSGRTWETRFDPKRPGAQFYIAPRVRFDALVRDHAVSCGAEFVRAAVTGLVFDGARAVGVRIKQDRDEREIGARVVVGADGATSAVARALGVGKPSPRDRAVAIRAYASGIDVLPNTVEFYFYRRFVPGYAWVFPMGEGRANVGVIARADRFRRDGASLRELLGAFLDMPAVRQRAAGATIGDEASWQLPFNVGPASQRAFDGALLVGDAGGFVDSLTGEGIHNAVLSATIAAGVVCEALARGDTTRAALCAYDERWREVIEPGLRRARRCHRWIAAVPPVLETLFVLANAGRPAVRSWLNRMSNDFVIHA